MAGEYGRRIWCETESRPARALCGAEGHALSGGPDNPEQLAVVDVAAQRPVSESVFYDFAEKIIREYTGWLGDKGALRRRLRSYTAGAALVDGFMKEIRDADGK